ncbi:MAG TPA: sulfur carrier protein ThiS [Candidatus Kapabacteria bacterium]|nr:sulfur carrier protein ThiS [Candidatus Kapabacteria bacterium]
MSPQSPLSPTRLIIAGEEKEITARSVNDLLGELRLPEDGRGIAIAINDAVISKSRWTEHELRDGDRIEIVRATQGG